ncbi:hypothetical protein TTHERM_00145640 (macronuclear) [Tetrahymena thermophila SB210]|uniref:Uncharacterized protein n=1 Tax=Tetrahymena thermophila (strain SB210) TaxID=312017 RepID=I7M7C3_TETTS|nr:hypothetical protein TTHERM_00145640 [Tetrahymena thermophila SB210]EAR90959.2 hypothetical protein TTHERM_00145640 [Tetrahymena thermophila SB210]|eukprot:XP_001011204.2 hypothetical protein TTHERM_00145640 [Tetrahymena thermophila SB210]
MLSTSISNQDYLKVTLPFPLHNFLTPSGLAPSNLNIPTDLIVQYQSVDTNTNLPVGNIYDVLAFTQSVESYIYYLQFLDTNKNTINIPNNQWFNIIFTVQNLNATTYQKGSQVLQISMQTVSSTNDQIAIIYDENLIFGTFYLNDRVNSTLGISAIFIDQVNKYKLNQLQGIYVDIDLTSLNSNDIDDKFRIDIVTDNPNFLFVDQCFSALRYELPTIPQITQQNYTCNIDQSRNIINVLINKVVFIQQKLIRIQVFVQNPPIVELSGSLEVRLLRFYSPQIVASGYSYNLFQTTQVVLVNHNILLGWGLQSESTLPMSLKIIRGNSDSSYQPLNSIRVTFQVDQKTSDTNEIRVNVNLKQIQVASYILKGSIMTNLPSFPQKEVVCIETGKTNIINRQISCQGVGQLIPSTTYFISFKMFLAYDIYQDDLQTSNFGSITIDSIIQCQTRNRIFILSRSIEFIKYMISSSQANPLTSNKVNMINSDTQLNFLQNLKNFPNVKLLFRASDFEGYTDDVVIHNRSYLFDPFLKLNSYDDFIMPVNVQNFVTFAQQKINDMQIIEILMTRDTDNYPCRLHYNQLVTLSIPKNQNSFQTINGKNLQRSVSSFPVLVSSLENNRLPTSQIPFQPQNSGLRTSTSEQFLLFNTQFNFANDITNQITYNDVVLDNLIQKGVGFIILTNPNIRPYPYSYINNFISINPVTNSVYAEQKNINLIYNRQSASTSLNKYTSIKAIFNSGACLQHFISNPASQTEQQWLLSPFLISQFSSNMVDENVYDFYFQVIDYINGPIPNQVIRTTSLFNAYFITNNAFIDPPGSTSQTLNLYLTNMFQQINGGNNGYLVPTVIKIEGKLTSYQNSYINRLSVFFNNLKPFYKNSYSNDIYCGGSSNEIQLSCKAYLTQNYDINNYLTLSRIEIQATNLQQNFYLIVPVSQSFVGSPYQISLYLAGMKLAPFAVGSSLACFTSEVNYIQKILTTQPPYTMKFLTYTSAFNWSFKSSAFIGKTQEDFSFQALYTDSGITNFSPKSSAALVFTTDFPFYDTQISQVVTTTPNTCFYFRYSFDYYYASNYNLTSKYGIYCRNIPTTTNVDLQFKIIKSNVPYNHGQEILGYASWSKEDGLLTIVEQCIVTRVPLAKIGPLQLLSPVVTGNNLQQIVIYQFTTPVDLYFLKYGLFVEIKAAIPINTIPYQFVGNPQCQIQVQTSQSIYDIDSLQRGSVCTFYSILVSDSSHIFQITNIQGYFPAQTQLMFSIYYQPRVSVSSTSAQIQLLLSAGAQKEYIATSTLVTASYQSSLVANVQINSLTPLNSNSFMRSTILLKFSFVNRYWWVQESFSINMDKFATADNNLSNQMKCKILESDMSVSNRFQTVDVRDLTNLQIIPKVLIMTNPTIMNFYLQCLSIIIPSSPNTFSYKVGSISLPTTFSAPSFNSQPPIGQVDPQINKMYLSIGSDLEIQFTLTSSVVTLYGSQARVIISFPVYYPPRLSKENIISCYLLKPVYQSITCYITQLWMLEIRYFMTQIPPNTEFVILIAGVTQPLSYNQGTFYIYLDSDENDSSYDEYFTILDNLLDSSITSLFNTAIEVYKLTITSNYLRQNAVYYQFDIFIDSSAPNIQFGQAVMVSFPNIYDQPLRVNQELSCSIYNYNQTNIDYCSQCIISGLRVKMYVSQTMVLGQLYSIIIYTLRNPGRFDASVQKWVIEVSDASEQYIIMRSFDTTANYMIDEFIQNPYQSYINFYDSPSTSPNSKIVTQLTLIKGVFSNWLYIRPQNFNSMYLWQQSFILSSNQDQISTMKVETSAVVGAPGEIMVRIYSQNAIGQYDFQISKYGDSNFYSDLNIIRLYFSDLNVLPLSLSQSIYQIYTSTTSFNLYLQLNGQIYSSNLNLQFTVPPTGNLGLKLGNNLNQFTVNFNNGIMIGYLPIVLLDQTQFIPSSSVTLQVSFNGDNAKSYQWNTNTIQLQAIPNPSATLILQLIPQTSPSYINNKEFKFSCSQKGYFYYYVALYYHEKEEMCQYNQNTISQYAWAQNTITTDNSLYPCNSVFGVIYIDSTTLQTLQVENLLANRYYRIGAYCQSQLSTTTVITKLTFEQNTNNGSLYKIQVDFAQNPNINDIVKFLCYLSIHFTHHPKYVSTIDGITCQELSQRRLLTQQKILQFFTKGISYLKNKKRHLQSSNLIWNPSQCTTTYQLNNTAKVFSMNFYIDSNEIIPNDSATLTKILTDTTNGCFVSYTNQVLLGITTIVNIYKGQKVEQLAPTPRFNDPQSIFLGNTWAYLDQFSLTSTYGRIWGILVFANSTIFPSPRQIRAGLDSQDKNALAIKNQEFNFNYIREFNATFIGLNPGQSYIFYYVASNENPFESIQYSSVNMIKFTTIQIPLSSLMRQFKLLFLLLPIVFM